GVVPAVWDHLPRRTKLLLVLTGSAVSTVEAMLTGQGPLRGRPTDTLRLDPLDPWSARLFLPRLDPAAYLEAYAACGGYPLHLLAWDQSASTEQNLERLGGTAGGILLEDAASIMSDELAEAGGYARILAAIGRGRTRYAEIAGETDQRVEYPLDVLARSGFVAKVAPVGASRASRTLYAITDPYLAFWFRVLYSDLALIQGGPGRAVLQRARPRCEDDAALRKSWFSCSSRFAERADQRGVRERGPGQGRPHRATLRARPRRRLSLSVSVSRPKAREIREARRGRDAAAPHHVLQAGAVNPERPGRPAHVSAMVREGLREILPLQPEDGVQSGVGRMARRHRQVGGCKVTSRLLWKMQKRSFRHRQR